MNGSETERLTAAVEQLCMLVAAHYVEELGELDQSEKAERLSRCGLAATKIAGLLGSNTNAVNVALHRARKAKKKGVSKKKGR